MKVDNSRNRILTGDRPTGAMHLGHYFGSLVNRVKLQNEGYETYIIIADYQVLTDRLETDEIEKNIFEIVRDYLAVGLDPKKSVFFIQSQIPQLAELTTIFSMLTSFNRVRRNPTVKEEIKSMSLGDNFSVGMFSYPVSQAADILLFNPSVIPVGEDQLPHIELTKEIARKFNSIYSEVFRVPEALLSNVKRLAGLDGNQKMSKSRNNAIFLGDSEEEVVKKIKSAVTDSGNEIEYFPAEKPNISNLLELYELISGKRLMEIENHFKGKGYKEFKESLAEEINKFLKPIREKREGYSDEMIKKILIDGNKAALEEGELVMKQVRKAMKMDYLKN